MFKRILVAVDGSDVAELALDESIKLARKLQVQLRNAGAVASQAGIPVETGLIEIDTLGQRIPETIVADAEAWPADLIVVGTHGRRVMSHLFLGSVAEGGVRVATKPVLLIQGQ